MNVPSRKNQFLLVFILAIFLTILLIIGFLSYLDSKDRTAFKIGGHTTQLGACLKIAEAKGFYEKHGLSASVRLVESSKISMAAMEAGDFDVVIGSLSAGSFNMVRKGDLIIIADGSRVIPSVIIRKNLWEDGKIKQLADLKGWTIRTPREGSSSYYALSKILRGINLTIEDVKPKYLKEREAVAALEANQIDAAILNEPYATIAVKKGLGIRYDLEEVKKFFPPKGQQHMVIYARRKTMEKKPELLRRFLKAYVEAVVFYDHARNGKQPQRGITVGIIAEYTEVDAKTVEKTVWPYVSPDGKPDVSYIKEMHDYFVERTLVDEPVNLGDVIHLEFLPRSK